MDALSELRGTVRQLENTLVEAAQLTLLQKLGDLLLTRCCLDLGEGGLLIPLWVEAYYYCPGRFEDPSVHRSPGQMDRFGRLYLHRKGYGGADICLSLGGYHLSFLLKYSLVEGVFLSQLGLRDLLKDLPPGLGERMVLAPLPEGLRDHGPVYHSPRKGLGEGPFRLARLASIRGVGEYPFRYERGFGKTRLLKEASPH